MQDLIERYNLNIKTGLTSKQVQERRSPHVNIVDPPCRCPAWICCLLPCLKALPSRKAFAAMQPEDAQVKRNNKWMRYEASCLVEGDLIRVEAGDFVPADCRVVEIETTNGSRSHDGSDGNNDEVFIVDHSKVTGEDRQSWTRHAVRGAAAETNHAAATPTSLPQLYWGGQVIQGSAVAFVTSIGPDTFVARLIQQGKFPVKAGGSSGGMTGATVAPHDMGLDEEEGISLMASAAVNRTIS